MFHLLQEKLFDYMGEHPLGPFDGELSRKIRELPAIIGIGSKAIEGAMHDERPEEVPSHQMVDLES